MGEFVQHHRQLIPGQQRGSAVGLVWEALHKPLPYHPADAGQGPVVGLHVLEAHLSLLGDQRAVGQHPREGRGQLEAIQPYLTLEQAPWKALQPASSSYLTHCLGRPVVGRDIARECKRSRYKNRYKHQQSHG